MVLAITVSDPSQTTYASTHYFINIKQAKTCTATQGGGVDAVSTFKWRYDNNTGSAKNAVGTNNSGTNAASTVLTAYAINPTVEGLAVGSHTIVLTGSLLGDYTDTVYSGVVQLTVNADLTVTVTTPTATNIVVGETVKLSVTPAGGNGTYTYQWYEDESSMGGSYQTASINYTPTVIAAHAMECVITDNATANQSIDSEDTTVLTITANSVNTMMSAASGYLAKISKAVS